MTKRRRTGRPASAFRLGLPFHSIRRIAAIASGVLAEHRFSGDSEINVTRGSRLDYFVNLDDTRGQRAAAAIEFGHTAPDGSFVEGIHALTRSFK